MSELLPGSLLAKIIGISSDAIICIDQAQRITFFNDGAVRIFGYSAAEVIGQPLELLIPERSRAIHGRHIEEFERAAVQARKMADRREIAGRRKNGEEFPAEAAIAKLHVGDSIMASVVLRDVSDQKRTDARQRALMNTAEILSSSLDLVQTKQQLVRFWIPMFGDVAVFETMHRDAHVHLRAEATSNGDVVTSEISVVPGGTVLGAGGGVPPVSVVDPAVTLEWIPAMHRGAVARLVPTGALVVSLVRGGRYLGRVSLFTNRILALDADDLVLAQDLAARAAVALENARLHDELARALRARDDTMSVVSHDLRNPVSAVKMLTAALLRPDATAPLSSVVREQIAVIRSAAGQMDALIQDLLDLSRAEAGPFPLDMRWISCDAAVRDALGTLAPLAADKSVSLVADLADGLPEVRADPERVVQVISNVVGNAIKFTPVGGDIRIVARAQHEAVVISVTDSGPGIPAEQLTRVFDRFWQSKLRRDGVGLGLPIAKAIIEAHGGRIWAECVEGRGATFHFTLPA